MPIDFTPPMFIAGKLCWDIHNDERQTTFWVSATTFKYAVGLRPRARDDDAAARTLADKNWTVLELIAKEALQTGRISKTDASKGWQVHHTLDDRVFTDLFKKYEAQIVR